MKDRPLDVLFVNADSSAQAYQELSKDFSAIEPPTWALLLAQACRANGFGVAILDCGAERLSDEQSVQRIGEAKARLVCFVVYGQNPNSGTTNMIGTTNYLPAGVTNNWGGEIGFTVLGNCTNWRNCSFTNIAFTSRNNSSTVTVWLTTGLSKLNR